MDRVCLEYIRFAKVRGVVRAGLSLPRERGSTDSSKSLHIGVRGALLYVASIQFSQRGKQLFCGIQVTPSHLRTTGL